MHDISMIQIILVTLVAFLAGCDSVLDERMFYRPIIACTLTGLALGDPTTGIMVGGALELLSLGWMNVGAAMAPDAALASTVFTVIVIAGGQTRDEAIAVAVPLTVGGRCCLSSCGRLGWCQRRNLIQFQDGRGDLQPRKYVCGNWWRHS